MRKQRKTILLLVLLLAVGFAAVTTTLIISGNTRFTTNNDFDVIFTKAIIDDVEDNSVISADGKSISYTTKELSFIDDHSKLDFTVKNNSTQYDAEVSIECVGGSNAGIYYEITENFTSSIPAQTEAEGNVTVTMIRSSVNDIEETFTCTITGNAIERDKAAEVVPTCTIANPTVECNAEGDVCWTDSDCSETRTIGDIVALGTSENSIEQFYILSDDGTNTQMLSMYNLYVGNVCTTSDTTSCTPYTNPTGIQDSTMIGFTGHEKIRIGTTTWASSGTNYSGSIPESHVINYSSYLKSTLGIENTGTLISKAELESIVGQTLSLASSLPDLNAPAFLYSTSYWTRTAYDSIDIWSVSYGGYFGYVSHAYGGHCGIRPVITINSTLFNKT